MCGSLGRLSTFISQSTFLPAPCPYGGHSGPESSLCSLSLPAPGKPGEVALGKSLLGGFVAQPWMQGRPGHPSAEPPVHPLFSCRGEILPPHIQSLTISLSIIRPAWLLNLHSHISILATFFSPAQWGQSMGWPHLALCFHCTWSGSSSHLQGHPCPIPSSGRAYLSFSIRLQSQLQNVHSVPNPKCSQPLAQLFGTCSFSTLRDIFPFSCRLD